MIQVTGVFQIKKRFSVKGTISGQAVLDAGADTLVIQDKGKTVSVNPQSGAVAALVRPGEGTVVNPTDEFYFPQATIIAYALNNPTTVGGIKTDLSPGFLDISDVQLAFADGTRTITVSAAVTDYDIITSNGTKYTKTSESLQIPDTEGLHYVYFDNAGVLQCSVNPDRNTQYDLMLTTLPVSYIYWDATNKQQIFFTDLLKKTNMPISSWVKNFFDFNIYALQGLTLTDEPVSPTGNVNTDAQFGITAGKLLFVDRKYDVDTRAVGDLWEVLFLENGKLRHYHKSNFAVLQETDLGGGSSLLVYNNGSSPTVATSGNFVWYFVGISNNDTKAERLVSFMGQNEYITSNAGKDGLEDERRTVERSFAIRQEFRLMYALLFETKSSFTNAVKARIVAVEEM